MTFEKNRIGEDHPAGADRVRVVEVQALWKNLWTFCWSPWGA
jgi:hypothetical protein